MSKRTDRPRGKIREAARPAINQLANSRFPADFSSRRFPPRTFPPNNTNSTAETYFMYHGRLYRRSLRTLLIRNAAITLNPKVTGANLISAGYYAIP